ncbi:MAG: hypothetical protein HC868_16945 [Sphingomonadales bacterium]|nr:hypothetical protein [Sphingomonadales bacterium]
MAYSKLIAGLMGPVLAAMGVALLVNRGLFPAMIGQIADSYALIFLSGILSLLAGIAIVRVHNIWSGWAAIVTVFGWLAILGGLARMWIPQQAAPIALAVGNSPAGLQAAGAVVLVLGAFLSYKAYGPDN